MADLQQIASNNERAEALINSIEAEASISACQRLRTLDNLLPPDFRHPAATCGAPEAGADQGERCTGQGS